MTRLVPLLLLVLLAAGCDRLPKGQVFAPGLARGAAEDQMIVGHRLMDAGEYELALKAYTRAVLTHGQTPRVLTALGSANLGLGRLGQAEQQLRRATKEDGASPEAWNNLGVVLMERRQYGEAVQVFRRAFATSSGESEVIRTNLTKALALRDDPLYDVGHNNTPQLVRRTQGNALRATG